MHVYIHTVHAAMLGYKENETTCSIMCVFFQKKMSIILCSQLINAFCSPLMYVPWRFYTLAII